MGGFRAVCLGLGSGSSRGPLPLGQAGGLLVVQGFSPNRLVFDNMKYEQMNAAAGQGPILAFKCFSRIPAADVQVLPKGFSKT